MAKVTFVSRLFYDRWTGTGGGGTTYPNYRVGDKARMEEIFYYKWGTYDKRLIFNSAGKTITRLDGYSFIDDEHSVGDTIIPSGTSLNTTALTIASVEDDVITVVEALTDETAESASLNNITPVDHLDYFVNTVFNRSAASFNSLVDINSECIFAASGLDPSDTTPIAMTALGRSQAWNTTTSITVEGVSNSDYEQRFKVIHQFYITPLWLKGQDNNFENVISPSYFPMKVITQVNGKYNAEDPNPAHSSQNVEASGIIGWFNEPARGSADYTLGAIVCDDNDFDFNVETTWAAQILSDAGNFTASSKVQICFFRCPSNDQEYNYRTISQLKAMLFDDAFLQVGTGGNGANYGTDYQVLRAIDVILTDANTISISFKINMADAIKDFLKTLDPGDRKFCIGIMTQDPDITTTAENDRVHILAAFENAGYNQDDSSLIEIPAAAEHYGPPGDGGNATNNVVGWNGDAYFSRWKFQLKVAEVDGVTPTMQTCGVQVVAIHATKKDFVPEEKIFDCSTRRKLNGVQDIDFSGERGYRVDQYDQTNKFYLKRYTDLDDDAQDLKGFILQYGYILRYDFWNKIVQNQSDDIFQDLQAVDHEWGNLIGNGWTLVLRFIATVQGYDGHVTEFKYDSEMIIKQLNNPASTAPAVETQIQFFDEEDVEVHSVLKDAPTKVVVTYTGDFETYPASTDTPFGELWADLNGPGGPTNRRWASTVRPTDPDTPWSPTDADDTVNAGADDTWADHRIRIAIFGTTKIVVSGWYDDQVDAWSRVKNGSILIYNRLGFYKDEEDTIIYYIQ